MGPAISRLCRALVHKVVSVEAHCRGASLSASVLASAPAPSRRRLRCPGAAASRSARRSQRGRRRAANSPPVSVSDAAARLHASPSGSLSSRRRGSAYRCTPYTRQHQVETQRRVFTKVYAARQHSVRQECSPDTSRAARARLGLARPLISRCSLRTSSTSVSPIVCATSALLKPRAAAKHCHQMRPSDFVSRSALAHKHNSFRLTDQETNMGREFAAVGPLPAMVSRDRMLERQAIGSLWLHAAAGRNLSCYFQEHGFSQ